MWKERNREKDRKTGECANISNNKRENRKENSLCGARRQTPDYASRLREKGT